MAGLFERHDRGRFEIFGISFGPDVDDGMRRRLRPAFDRFIDVGGNTDREVALLLRELEIDIAVDLKGYTGDNRTGILAQRGAPVQVNYLGYPGTMGADFFDYILADRLVIPPELEPQFSERVVRLPGSYQVKRPAARDRSAHAIARRGRACPRAGFVFCCFNNNYKNHSAGVLHLDAASGGGRGQRAVAVGGQRGRHRQPAARRPPGAAASGGGARPGVRRPGAAGGAPWPGTGWRTCSSIPRCR